MKHFIAILTLALATSVFYAFGSAETERSCTVATVHDGDSMRVRCPNEGGTQRIRMAQIDAPELDQAYGTRARDHLRRLCTKGSPVTIQVVGTDQYGRMLGNVSCNGKSVNEELVSAGAAWVYDRHVIDHTLYTLQDEAKQARRGLWAERNPEAPWRWRYRQRSDD